MMGGYYFLYSFGFLGISVLLLWTYKTYRVLDRKIHIEHREIHEFPFCFRDAVTGAQSILLTMCVAAFINIYIIILATQSYIRKEQFLMFSMFVILFIFVTIFLCYTILNRAMGRIKRSCSGHCSNCWGIVVKKTTLDAEEETEREAQ